MTATLKRTEGQTNSDFEPSYESVADKGGERTNGFGCDPVDRRRLRSLK